MFLKPILGKIIIVGHFTLSEFMCPYFDLKKIPIYLIRIAIQFINFESIHKFWDRIFAPCKLGFLIIVVNVLFFIFILLLFIFYCVFYSLVSDPALLLIAGMLCKLPEKTTLRTYMYILILLLLIIIIIIILFFE